MTHGQTNEALFRACKSGNPDTARLFLERGADVNARNKNGYTPLHYACWKGHGGTVHLLLDHGADPNARGGLEDTPLHWACFHGRTGATRLLLDHGADANARNKWGDTPLSIVLQRPADDPRREEIIDLFRQHHPEMVMEAWCSPGLQP